LNKFDWYFHNVVFLLCFEDRFAEKFIGGGELIIYGFIIRPGDGRPRKSGWYNDDWHRLSHLPLVIWDRLRAANSINQYVHNTDAYYRQNCFVY